LKHENKAKYIQHMQENLSVLVRFPDLINRKPDTFQEEKRFI